MILEQRVIHQSTDISRLVNDFRTGEYTFAYTAGQYLYIGSLFPFNNLYFEVGTPNAVPAVVNPQVWWGHKFVDLVDVQDGTNGLFNSGRIQFNTDLDYGWDIEQRSADVLGLEPFKIFNMYWVRLSWDVSLSNTTTIKYIGQKFSSDDILTSYYPDLTLAALKEAFEVGKTTWDEQHYMAAERVISDLKRRDIIKSRTQLLDHELFIEPSCHKVAEIVYKAFGIPYFDQLKQARADYDESLNLKFFNTDCDGNGRLDEVERHLSTGFMRR